MSASSRRWIGALLIVVGVAGFIGLFVLLWLTAFAVITWPRPGLALGAGILTAIAAALLGLMGAGLNAQDTSEAGE